MAALLLAVAAIALRPLTTWRLAAAAALLTVAFLCRPVEGVIGVAMLLVPAVSLLGSRRAVRGQRLRTGPRLLVLVAGVPAAAVLLAWQGSRYLPALAASLAGEPEYSLAACPVAVKFDPSVFDFAHAVLNPVRWFGAGADLAIIPGALVWTVMLLAMALGCWLLLRSGAPAARGVIVSALGFLYLYTCVFQGAGFQPAAVHCRGPVPGDGPVRLRAVSGPRQYLDGTGGLLCRAGGTGAGPGHPGKGSGAGGGRGRRRMACGARAARASKHRRGYLGQHPPFVPGTRDLCDSSGDSVSDEAPPIVPVG